MGYPTKEGIMDKQLTDEINYPEEVIDTMYTIKSAWYKATNHKKTQLLYTMITLINHFYNGKPFCITEGKEYCYHPNTQTIVLGKPLSIISSLHELGHHLFGPSELKACRFSVHLFKKVFPKAFAKLIWHGHMLKQN